MRGIAEYLNISRAKVGDFVRSPKLPEAKPRVKQGSKLDVDKEYMVVILGDVQENCIVPLRQKGCLTNNILSTASQALTFLVKYYFHIFLNVKKDVGVSFRLAFLSFR